MIRPSWTWLVALLVFSGWVARADQIDDLIKQLGHQEEEMRVEAAEKLTEIGGPRVQKQFREMLKSESPERRQVAVVGLLQVSEGDADVELVRGRLKDEGSMVRWSAALALGQTGRAEVVPWLEELSKSDQSELVREAATDAVAKLRAGIQWGRSLPEALRQAKELGKPVLAYFRVRGSNYCQQFELGVLASKEVVDASQEFVCVRVDALQRSDEARKFDVRGAPTVLILDGSGNEMARVAGLVERPAFLSKLAETRRGKLTFREARRLALGDPKNVAANWKVAETFLDEGREDLAEPHLRNVISSDEQNQYGHTDNALFALGFALGKKNAHAQAVYCFEQLLTRWPDFKDKDKALYCMGLSQLATGQKDKARASLERLLHEVPDSPMVKNARQVLEKLEAKGQ